MKTCVNKKHPPLLADDPQNHFSIKGWRGVTILPAIDKEKTKERVVNLLSQYRAFVRLADEEFEPKVTTTYSLSPRSITNQVSKPVEDAVVLKVTAEQELIKINKAINKLNAYDRQRIFDKYISRSEISDKVLIMNYSESESGFYKRLNIALLKFAEAYEGGRLIAFLKIQFS